MTQNLTADADFAIPSDIAKAVLLPQSYLDEARITYPAFAWLRENNPLGVARLDGFDPLWLVTKHSDLREVERQPALFTSGDNNPILGSRADDDFIRGLTGGSTRSIELLVYMDPPEHTDIRGIANDWFLPRHVRKFEEDMRVLARRHVDKLLQSEGEFDFVKDFALYYPLHVIMTLFGVPEADEPMLLKLSQELFGVNDPDEQDQAVAPEPDVAARMWASAVQGFYDYFGEKIADRRAHPTEDLMSLIANSKVDGEYLPDTFCSGWYIAVATAGHDTTSSSIAGAFYGMHKFPEQWAKVKANPALIPALVDEAVRWTSPVKHFMRTASQDTELRGRQIRKGDRLMLNYPSANRDEDVFEHADAFDVTRPTGRHIAFGVGPHACVGMHVAKLEMKVLLEELLPRIESFELTGTPQWTQTNFVGGIKSMPMRITKT